MKAIDEKKVNQKVLLRARLETSRSKGFRVNFFPNDNIKFVFFFAGKLCFLTLRQGAFSIQGVLFQSNEISPEMLYFAES